MPIPSHRPIPCANRGHTTAATLGFLTLCALVQLGLFLALQSRTQAPVKSDVEHPANPQPQANADTKPANASDPANLLPDSLPPVEPPAPPPATPPSGKSSTRLVASPEPVPAPASTNQAQAPATETTDPTVLPRDDMRALVAEAIRLRRAGDMAGAIAKLNTALDSLPGHPRLLFEMAATYEAMGMTERASENFRKVADLGPAHAGALAAIANRRLQEGIQIPGANNNSDDDPLFFGSVQEIRQPDASGQNILLRIDIHARPGTTIDPAGVNLPVQFFDLAEGKRVEPATASPSNIQWTSQPVDWKEPGIETVEVSYHLPALSANDIATSGERKYLGYLVELYYQDMLLDVMARPRRLSRYQIPQKNNTGLPDSLPDSLGGALLENAPDSP